MNIGDFSFHDAALVEIKQLTETQTLELLIDFPVDWPNNVFQRKILRFNKVYAYSVKTIPFDDFPIILEIEERKVSTTQLEFGTEQLTIVQNKINIVLNSGNMVVEYATCDLIDL